MPCRGEGKTHDETHIASEITWFGTGLPMTGQVGVR
jgi:hypothetical protein